MDILNYLNQQIETKLANNYEVFLEWDKRTHQISIVIELFVENQNNYAIEDIDGTEALDIISFEDEILLNGGKISVDNDDYLLVVEFDRKKGISRQFLDELVEELLITLDNGQSDLLDFVDNDEEIFELSINKLHNSVDKGDMLKYPKY